MSDKLVEVVWPNGEIGAVRKIIADRLLKAKQVKLLEDVKIEKVKRSTFRKSNVPKEE